MAKKFSVIFSGKVESYLIQVYLHPFLLVLSAIIIGIVVDAYSLEKMDYLFSFLACWILLGMVFRKVKPFYFFVGRSEGAEDTNVTVGYRSKKLTGVLRRVDQTSESIKFVIKTKKETDEVEIPSRLLGDELNSAMVEVLTNIGKADFSILENKLRAAGLRAEIKDGGDFYYNLYAGSKPSYIPTRLIMTALSLIACGAIILFV